MRELVRTILLEAQQHAGSHKQLVAQITPLIGRHYEQNSVSAWLKGRNMPPADVLLAAVKVTENAAKPISLDDLLFGESLQEQMTLLKEEVRGLTGEVADLKRRIEMRPLLAGAPLPLESQ